MRATRWMAVALALLLAACLVQGATDGSDLLHYGNALGRTRLIGILILRGCGPTVRGQGVYSLRW